MAACACSLLKPTPTPPPAFYSLDGARDASAAAAPDGAPTLIVNPPSAVAGFDSSRIIFVRETHKLEYFAHSEWVDPPARMLMPLLAAAVGRTGAFRAVVLTPSAAAADLRLDTQIIRLQHEFLAQPSRVRFTLRAHLVDNKTRHVIAWREFDAVAPAASENPYGGVVAANRAVQTVLEELAAFCAESARAAAR
jgi:cholesterol transport system auxiliary component